MTAQQFITASDLFPWALAANPHITLDKIDSSTVDYANAQVETALFLLSLYDTIGSDHAKYSILQNAAKCYGMEKLNYDGKIRWSTGDVATTVEGPIKIEYQRWQPMFFFAQGDPGRFNSLLPHETWRMTGYRFVDAFVRYYWDAEGATETIQIKYDNYARGRGATEINEYYRYT